jgi:formimidoylglutamate deiminase
MKTLYRPDLMYIDGAFVRGRGVLVGDDGMIVEPTEDAAWDETTLIEMRGKAIVPGFVNVHSHSFQRLIRGKSESRIVSGKDFWSWRGTMYHAAAKLTPQQVYDVARMTFLEMLLAGTTTVGEFHYLHLAPDGDPYDDPNLLAKQVIAAAQSVGIRIVLLRTAYLRAGFELGPDAGQKRFYETTSAFIESMEMLYTQYPGDTGGVTVGVAPHSVRAVPLPELKHIVEWARAHHLPIHMHVAEQIAENTACNREYGVTPVEMLSREGILGADFTAIHGVHISSHEVGLLAKAGAKVGSCPTTERNLGDGTVRADHLMNAGIPIALGSDSQAQIDPLEDARELDYHLRLQQQERAILDQIGDVPLAKRLLDCATINGARALGLASGELRRGSMADFFTIDLGDPSIAGHSADDLLSMIVFSLDRSGIRDVVVGGKIVLREGKHPLQQEIIDRYRQVHDEVWWPGGDRDLRR